nr:uncharacterized protein LOC129161649 isoform X2 [Nothobranchius furzeri]
METTPKVSDELKLLQAGMGRRTINITEDADHSWLSRKLEDAYSQLAALKGAWMLYKAVGGSGRRKLCIVPPEADGYTGAYLSTVGRGKSTLYIVPVQGTIDMSPLPYSAKEFEKMPKAPCQTCSVNMPIQLLAAHVESCKNESLSISTYEEIEDFQESAESTHAFDVLGDNASDTPESVMSMKAECPICEKMFSSDLLEIHASYCGERASNASNPTTLDDSELVPKRLKTHTDTKSIADIIKCLNERVDETSIFNISVTREDILERGLKQWQRQKKSSPRHPLRVSFIGEPGIDSGALRKEFLTDMVSGIETRFFEGGESGKNPKYSMIDVDKHNFQTIGEIFAVSITQGGPPPNFLMQWCYKYMSNGEIDQDGLNENDVTDPELMELMKEIKEADETTLMTYTDRILLCGYTGPITIQKKEDILRSTVLHATMRLLPMLQQICSGMKLYGLLSLVQQEKDICRQLFVPGSFGKVDADFLVQSLSPVFSESGTMKRQRENRIVNFLQDFVQDMDDQDTTGGEQSEEFKMDANPERTEGNFNSQWLNVGKFCQWLTGQRHIPLSPTERGTFKIVMEFDHDCSARFGKHSICYPVVNACSCSITFPVSHLTTYLEFKTVISQAIIHGNEFGRH